MGREEARMNKRISLEALITEREGMVAQNTHRLFLGQGTAYDGYAFASLAGRISALAENADGEKNKSANEYLAKLKAIAQAGRRLRSHTQGNAPINSQQPEWWNSILWWEAYEELDHALDDEEKCHKGGAV